jgi:hypothetical protein
MSDPVRRPAPPVVGTHPRSEIQQLRTVSRLLDSAFSIPGTRYRFGLDALIGLVPGVGDAVGAIFSGYIILQASRAGASRATINRMIANVAIDTVVGWVPLLGDLFDVGWKANTKNVALLEQYLQHPAAARASSRRSLLLLGAVLLALVAGAVALGALVAQLVLNLLSSLS